MNENNIGSAGTSGRPSGHSEGGDPYSRVDAPLLELTLWPHRSLSLRGFNVFFGLFTACLALPLVALAGTAVAWGLLPFLAAMLIGVYLAFRRNYQDAALVERLQLWPDLITVERREPRGAVLRWQANPAWVQVRLFENARIEKYLTLRGNGREIELGAFLSPDERVSLYEELRSTLANLGVVRPS